MPSSLRSSRGQASVELVAVLPLVVLIGLLLWQALLAGWSLWLSAQAARAAARAAVVDRSPGAAARSVLPRRLERGLRVVRDGAQVRVRVRVPLVVPHVRSPLVVGAGASLGGS